jgi:hypothetical protein
MMSSKSVRVERDGELALIVVHNPPVNTITADVRAGLSAAITTLGPVTAIAAPFLAIPHLRGKRAGGGGGDQKKRYQPAHRRNSLAA